MVGEWPIMGFRSAFLVVMPRGGPEPAVAHVKSVFGPESPILPGGQCEETGLRQNTRPRVFNRRSFSIVLE
jgi:hypothetical protein